MKEPHAVLLAELDEKNARFVVVGRKISFADPRTAKAAGCIVAQPPAPVVGAVIVSLAEPPPVPTGPRVICNLAGTEHQPPVSVSARKLRAARTKVDAPKARRRA